MANIITNPSLSVSGVNFVRGCHPCDGKIVVTGGQSPEAQLTLTESLDGESIYTVSFTIHSIGSGMVRFLDSGGGATSYYDSIGSYQANFTSVGTQALIAMRCTSNSEMEVSITNLELAA